MQSDLSQQVKSHKVLGKQLPGGGKKSYAQNSLRFSSWRKKSEQLLDIKNKHLTSPTGGEEGGCG